MLGSSYPIFTLAHCLPIILFFPDFFFIRIDTNYLSYTFPARPVGLAAKNTNIVTRIAVNPD